MEWIDDELCLVNSGEITHVFERSPSLSRAAYKHMCSWVLTNFESKFNGSHETLWAEAGESWASLTPETQGILFALQAREEQMVKDIRIGLLATLAGYQGLKSVKDKFAEAIRSVE